MQVQESLMKTAGRLRFIDFPGAVMGMPIVLLAFQDMIAEFGRIYLPGIEMWLPKRIEEIATQVTVGGPVSSTVPLFAIGLQIVLFTLVTFWRFKREEF